MNYVSLNLMGFSHHFQIVPEEDFDSKIPTCEYYGSKCTVCTCAECNKMGKVLRRDEEGHDFGNPCRCRQKAWSARMARQSGLHEEFTFSNFKTGTPWQHAIKSRAMEYANNPKGGFLITGTPGCGKTMLCSSIAHVLLMNGMSVKYMRWVKDATTLKSIVNEAGLYKEQMDSYSNAEVLVIDDLFKQGVTTGDIRLAFDLIDRRYNKPTIISSEKSIKDITAIDEAIGSRIYELCTKFGTNNILTVTGNDKNQRFNT